MPTLNVKNHAPYTAKCTLSYTAGGNNTVPSPAILDGQSWTPQLPEAATDVQIIVDPVGGRHPLTQSIPNPGTWTGDYGIELHGTVNRPSISDQ